MKKTIFLMIICIAALMGLSMLSGTPEHTGMRLMAEAAASSDSLLAEARHPQAPRQSMLPTEELNYYFERHNVQDEGYEMVAAYADGKRLKVTVSPHIDAMSIGTWQGNTRKGTALTCDSAGRTIVGTWSADTLETGIRLDEEGIYSGDFSGTKASGHGAYQHTDGSYFEGHWQQGKRQGFGLQQYIAPEGEPKLRVGIWTDDRYQGERMKYTSERIYGIDIARYQHGSGRKKYPINWKQMRITYIGKRGNKNVSGTADYPVSFVFIKSTESTKIRNKFYVNDYAQARKNGIHVGAYHFWSTRTSGSDQAKHFIRNTLFKQGDLPPVLDVEPSDAQIQQAGGPKRMFREIRTWLSLVERRTGVKPILYMNQRFINKYLSDEPDIKKNYRVWIARYSEYKPDVRLSFWQLCPDGRVAGIHGDVDINVFNGYKSQFEEFLEQETIR